MRRWLTGRTVTNPAPTAALSESSRCPFGEYLGHTHVVREPAEETGLRTTVRDVTLLGTLVDHVDTVPRVTVGALVTRWDGEPADQPDESVGAWRWHSLAALPSGMFLHGSWADFVERRLQGAPGGVNLAAVLR